MKKNGKKLPKIVIGTFTLGQEGRQPGFDEEQRVHGPPRDRLGRTRPRRPISSRQRSSGIDFAKLHFGRKTFRIILHPLI
jgi:hypothetical protein